MTAPVSLRQVEAADVEILHSHLTDPIAARMAAFTPPDTSLDAHISHWERILADDAVVTRTIISDATVVGHIACFGPPEERELTYWIDRSHWGRGIATAALEVFLEEVADRPLMARAAADNAASVRVLQKCGFAVVGHDRYHANARGAEIEEVVLRLDG